MNKSEFEKYRFDLNLFIDDFFASELDSIYSTFKRKITIPLIQIDNISSEDFEKSVTEHIWWSLNSIFYNVNNEDIYQTTESIMNSSEFREVNIWVLSKLIGCLIASISCNYDLDINKILSISLNCAWTETNQNYILEQFSKFKELF